jgi:predicted GTPase
MTATMKTGIAGSELNQILLRLIKEKNPQLVIRPNYLLSKRVTKSGQIEVHVNEFPNVTQSYHNFMIQQVIEDIKEVTCVVSDAALDIKYDTQFISIVCAFN